MPCDASHCHVTRVTLCVTWEHSLTRGSHGCHLTPDTDHNLITSDIPGEASVTCDDTPVLHLTGCRPPEMIQAVVTLWSVSASCLRLLATDHTPDVSLWSPVRMSRV